MGAFRPIATVGPVEHKYRLTCDASACYLSPRWQNLREAHFGYYVTLSEARSMAETHAASNHGHTVTIEELTAEGDVSPASAP